MLRLRNILVPVDFTDASRFAFEKACDYADQFGAAVHVLHVHTAGPVATEIGGENTGDSLDDRREFAEMQMQAFLGNTTDHCFPIVRLFATGWPQKAICECASEVDADLIVMGTHAGDTTRKRLTGSLTEHIVRRAPCDVLTVHESDVRVLEDELQRALAGSAS